MKKIVWLICLVMLLFMAVTVHGSEEGLLMHYNFDQEATDKKIVSANNSGYDATLEEVEVKNSVSEFSGAGTIILPENYATKMTESYSVAMWVKLDDSIKTEGYGYRFFDFGTTPRSCHFLRYEPASGKLSFMDRGVATSASDYAVDTTAKYINDGWTHIAFVYDFSEAIYAKASIYINGTLVANSGSYTRLTRSLYDMVGASSYTSYIGRTQWHNSENPDFKGKMDDIRIYNRAITDEEIAQLYEETYEQFPKAVVKFTDRNGVQLKDDVIFLLTNGEDFAVSDELKSTFTVDEITYQYNKYRSNDSFTDASGERVCVVVFDGYDPNVELKEGSVKFNFVFEDEILKSEVKEGYVGYDVAVEEGEMEHNGKWYLYDTAYTEVKEDTATVVVALEEKIFATEVVLEKTDLVIKHGESMALGWNILPENTSIKDMEWTSSDESVATVKDGVVTAVGMGGCVIRATNTDSGVFAECNVQVEMSGTTGEVEWILKDGVLTVSGNGRMEDYGEETNMMPWNKVRSAINKVVINDGVTHIGDYTFNVCENLAEIEMADSVLSIGKGAFQFNYKITAINLSKNLIEVGKNAFYESEPCVMTIPESLVKIGESAFQGNGITGEIKLSNIEEIGKNAFYNCKDITCVILGEKIKAVAEGAFSFCSNIKHVTLGENTESVGKRAFCYCDSLEEISFPEKVKTIGQDAFSSCKVLSSVKFGESVTSIGTGAFGYCKSLLSITLPDSVKTLGDSIFNGCTSLAEVKLPDSITEIPSWMFQKTSITSINIPLTVKKINFYAFEECKQLKDVYYEGSRKAWENVLIYSGNNYLNAANIHFENRDIEKISAVISEKSNTKIKTMLKNETVRVVEDVYVYAVQYEKDTVEKVVAKKLSFDKSEEKEVEFEVSGNVKIFIWDSDMKPVKAE